MRHSLLLLPIEIALEYWLLEHVSVVACTLRRILGIPVLLCRNGGRRGSRAGQEKRSVGASSRQQLLFVGVEFLQSFGLHGAVFQVDGVHEVLGEALEVFHLTELPARLF